MTLVHRQQRQQVLAELIAQMFAQEPTFREALVASFPELRVAPLVREQWPTATAPQVKASTVLAKMPQPGEVAALNQEGWVRPKRACQLLDIGMTTLYARLAEGAFVTKKICGCRLIKLSSIA
jgi:hypothetical protein